MSIIPWRKRNEATRCETGTAISELRREFDHLFDRFTRGFLDRPFDLLADGGGGDLRMELSESEQGYTLRFELPGVDPKDVQVDLTGGLLTVRGEKSEIREDRSERRWYSERTFGSFRRSVQLPSAVQSDQVEATFQNGVLTVQVPKDPKAQPRRIPVRAN